MKALSLKSRKALTIGDVVTVKEASYSKAGFTTLKFSNDAELTVTDLINSDLAKAKVIVFNQTGEVTKTSQSNKEYTALEGELIIDKEAKIRVTQVGQYASDCKFELA